MTEIVVRIPDEMAPLFEGKNVMVMPLSDEEAEHLRAALSQVAKTIDLNCKGLATLGQVLDTRASNEPDIARTMDMLKGPNKEAVALLDFVRALSGRSALLGQKPEEGRLQ